jgi:hypothetical protein
VSVEGREIQRYIQARVVRQDRGYDTPCWVWKRAKTAHGYSSARLKGHTSQYVHRASYIEWVGPIPDGMEIDHLCRVTLCVNPLHLEPVTPRENKRRQQRVKTHCKHGHPLTGENRMRNGKHHCCRKCRRVRGRGRVLRTRGTPSDPSQCRAGHPMTPENTIVWKDGTRCRSCNLAWRAAHDNHRAAERSRRSKQRRAARKIAEGEVSGQKSGRPSGVSHQHREKRRNI